MDPVAVITTAVTGLGADLGAVAAIGLAVGASVFALKKGWGLVKKFTS